MAESKPVSNASGPRSREVKGLSWRGKPMLLEGLAEVEGQRTTRSRSRTPIPTPANTEGAVVTNPLTDSNNSLEELAEGEADAAVTLIAEAGPEPAQKGRVLLRRKQGAGKQQLSAVAQEQASTGQNLANQAVAAIAKALGRRQKQVTKQKKADEPNRTAAKRAAKPGMPMPQAGAVVQASENDEVPSGEATHTANAVPGQGPKRVRKSAVLGASEDEDELPEEDSDADGEWEPDWVSEEDDDVIEMSQEESGLAMETLEGGLFALKDDSEDDLQDLPLGQRQAEKQKGGVKGRKPTKAKGAAEPAKKPNAQKRKKGDKAGEEPEPPNTDDEIWAAYASDMESDVPYMPKEMEQMEAPAELLMELLPYQKEFLAWAVKQEKGDICGGILADEMGMGKTIQAISVIVAHRTDDNSKLPPLVSDVVKEKAKEATAVQRPKLRLQNAPPKPEASGPLQQSGHTGDNEWEDVKAQAPAEEEPSAEELARMSSLVIHKGDTAAADMLADAPEGSNAALAHATSLKGPDAIIPAAEVPSPQKPPQLHTMMAVGQSCCGTDAQAATAPSGNFCRATLVICPLVAVIQWRQEIARYTAPGTLKVVVYHGNKRAASKEELENADVVLTTYSIVEGEYRRHTQPNKATCTYCNKKFYPDRLKVHLRFFCGPNAKKSDALAKQQKKRPRTVQQAAASEDEDDSDYEAADDSEEDLKRPAKRKQSANGKAAPKAKAKAAKSAGRKGKAVKNGKDGSDSADPKGKGIALASGKGSGKKAIKKPVQKATKKHKGKGSNDDDSEFSAGDESDAESSESSSETDDDEADSGEEGPSNARMRPKRVRNDSGWESRALAEAEKMIAASESRNSRAADVGQSILHEVRWRRITLDEAHSIKDRRCSTARAVFALQSKYKWALSGTPLQNRVSELYSLVRFLRIFPYAYYFCNMGHSKANKKKKTQALCSCKSLDYSFKTNWRKCDHCGHSPLHHYCYWNKWVANPIKKYGYVGKGRAAMRLLRSEILEKILLRRTKVQCADVLALPPRTVVLRKDRFDEREEDFYEALYTQSQAQFNAYVETGVVLNNYAHVFSLLVRLRQAVNHPYLVVHSSTAPGAGQGGAPGQKEREGNCNICHDPLEDGVAAACGHAFCRACITDYLESATGAAKCTACDRPLTIDLSNTVAATGSRVAGSKKDSIINRVSLSNFQSSTKIEALREELERMLQRDPSGKAIVFSQFTSMLDLIAFRLQQVGVKCVRLEGSQAMEQRDRMIAAFTADPDVRVFLMSLKAGGVALNLTAASHVMLMDPWWNPAVEQQAQDRIHRLGQYKPIHVTRFVIGGTIEERILKLQEKKQLVFEGTVGRDSDALGRLTEDDLRFLFG